MGPGDFGAWISLLGVLNFQAWGLVLLLVVGVCGISSFAVLLVRLYLGEDGSSSRCHAFELKVCAWTAQHSTAQYSTVKVK